MKIAGRDAGQLCVVTEVMDHQFVKVDGFTRPRKVNVQHLEPLGRSVELKKGAKSEDVRKALA
jgi:large subunit ribosomal protein L14e